MATAAPTPTQIAIFAPRDKASSSDPFDCVVGNRRYLSGFFIGHLERVCVYLADVAFHLTLISQSYLYRRFLTRPTFLYLGLKLARSFPLRKFLFVIFNSGRLRGLRLWPRRKWNNHDQAPAD